MNNGRPSTLQQEQARIDAARDFYLSRGKSVQVLAPFEFKPAPPRRTAIDPETVLHRKLRNISPAGRKQLRQMTEAL